MNDLLKSIFKNYEPNFDKLTEYGFTDSNGKLYYAVDIMDGRFTLNVTIGNDDISTEVIDLATGDPYTLFLADEASGGFVGKMRTEYETVMIGIAEKCFDKHVYKSEYARKIIRHVTDTYGDALEFLWEKFPDYAVWRRKDNKKWYGILLTIAKNKLGLQSEEQVEVIDLRVKPEDVSAIVDGKTVFGGYHMNKKHWVTVCLDGTVPFSEIEKMLDASYALAKK